MHADHIYKLQGILGVNALVFAALGFGAKGVLVGSKLTSKYIQFEFFISNLDSANIWAYVHWTSVAIFFISLLTIMLLERQKEKY
jgi:hypothetical protein